MTPLSQAARAVAAFVSGAAEPLLRKAAALRMRWGGARAWTWTGSSWAGAPWSTGGGQGDARANSVVFACVAWMARTFPEAPLRVQRRTRDGGLEPVPAHPLAVLVATPNPYYAGLLLWAATIADWVYEGNAYWAKIRNEPGGLVTQLWWLPAATVEPRSDGDGPPFITHYEYHPGGDPIRLAVEDVVHFRYGLDPTNPRKGLSPLRAVLREILTDEEASLFSSALLKNVGVPGVVLAPDPGAVASGPPPTEGELEVIKADFMAKFGGERRGEPLVLGAPMRVSTLSFSPDQMDLGRLRELPEERITAVLGLPAGVVGLGAGLARNTYSNYQEGRQAAYESNLIPTQRLFAAELQTQLLGDFGDPARFVVDFDLSQVRILQPDLDALWRRLDVAVQGGWLMVDEARERVGLPPLPGEAGQVLYVRATSVPTDPAELLPEEAPAELPAPIPLALPAAAASRASTGARRARPETKALDGLAGAVRRLRDRLAPGCGRAVAAFLAQQADRVAVAETTKDRGDTDWAAEARLLAEVLGPWFDRAAAGTTALAADALGVDVPLGDPEVAAALQNAGGRIVGITETTRRAVAEALAAGAAEGEAIGQLAQRIRDAAAFKPPRATTIARTELATTTNEVSVASYRTSGLVLGVRILDGPDCGLHAHGTPPLADGVVVPLERIGEVPVIVHPNCVRALAPVVDQAEMDGAA